MVLIIEMIVACILFHIMVYLMVVKNPAGWVDDYPPEIGRIARERGLVPPSPYKDKKALVMSKLVRCMFFALILGLGVYFLNGADTFLKGFLNSYAIFFAVAWYDALVIDCIWCCHSPKCRVPGTDDLARLYCDYGFHIRQSCLGSILGLPVAVVAGGVAALVNLLMR